MGESGNEKGYDDLGRGFVQRKCNAFMKDMESIRLYDKWRGGGVSLNRIPSSNRLDIFQSID